MAKSFNKFKKSFFWLIFDPFSQISKKTSDRRMDERTDRSCSWVLGRNYTRYYMSSLLPGLYPVKFDVVILCRLKLCDCYYQQCLDKEKKVEWRCLKNLKLELCYYWLNKDYSNPHCRKQKRIQNPVKHLTWRFSQK